MASAEHLSDLFASLPAGEKRKFMRQLTSLRARGDGHRTTSTGPKKAVNGFMAFRCEFSYVIPRHLV